MNDGFIVLNRRISSWRWWDMPNAVTLWLHILIGANWTDGYFLGQKIERGQLATSIHRLAEESGLHPNTVRHWLKKFEDEQQITLKSTNRYTLITVINYAKYQDCFTDDVKQNVNQDVKQDVKPPVNQDVHNRTRITKKQRNNSVFSPPTVDEVQAYITEKGYTVDAERFVDYYTANGWKVGRSKMVDWRRTVNNWQRNEKPQKITPEYTTKQDEQASADELAEARAMLERLKHD